MKKTIFALFLTSILASSCWKGDVLPSSDQDRRIVDSLTAVAGDEEVTLRWIMEEGWTPTDYIVTYTGDGDPVRLLTGGENPYTVKGLVNDVTYTFNVQAVYGEKISGERSVTATPKTTRTAVTDLTANAGKKSVELVWSRPEGNLTSYKITYGVQGSDATQTIDVDKDSTSVTITGLTDDIVYVFTIVAVYANGESLPCSAKAMPSSVIPYYISRDAAAIGQKIHFRFNRAGYPDATEVKWTMPDETVYEKDEIDAAFDSKGTKVVVLSAKVGGEAKQWNITLTIREYVIWFDGASLYGTANYNGFKGSCPVFSPDSTTLYDITFNKGTSLYAFDLGTGEKKWEYQAEGGSYNLLAVNPVSGDICFGTTTSGHFYCVKPDGTLRWDYTGLGSLQSAAPAVSKDGSKVFAIDADGKVVALNSSDGSQIWTYEAGSKGGSMLVNGDELVVAPTTSDLVFLNAGTGELIASIAVSEFGGANRTDIAGMAVAADKNTAYLPCGSGKLFSIDLKNHAILTSIEVKWGSETVNSLYEPVVAPGGNVYVGCKNSFVYCVKGDLSEVLWGYSHIAGTNNAYNYSHPCVDAQGNLYISSGQTINVNFIFSPDGTILNQWTYGSSANQKHMGGNNYLDGVLYSAFIGGANENGILVGKYVGGENAGGWCRHGGDICGSCCVK